MGMLDVRVCVRLCVLIIILPGVCSGDVTTVTAPESQTTDEQTPTSTPTRQSTATTKVTTALTSRRHNDGTNPTSVNNIDVTNSETTTAAVSAFDQLPWKWMTFGVAGLALIAIIIAVALAIYLCRVKGVLHKAATTMYSMSDDSTYNNPSKKQKGPKVELKQFTVTEEEIDSPTISPTPPPVRTIPPKQKPDNFEPPALVPRPKKVEVRSVTQSVPPKSAPPTAKPERQSSSSTSSASTSKRSSTSGIINPVFEAESDKTTTHQLTSQEKPQADDIVDDIYEEYAQDYENTATKGPEPRGVFAQDDNQDTGDYEEPFKLLNERSLTRTSEFLERQASASGLPDWSSKTSPSAESPLKVQSPLKLNTAPDDEVLADDSDNDETLYEQRDYDDVTDFTVNMHRRPSGKQSPVQEPSMGRSEGFTQERDDVQYANNTGVKLEAGELSEDGENYENTRNIGNDRVSFNSEGYDHGIPDDPLNATQSIRKQFPNALNRDSDTDSDDDSKVNYENTDIANALRTASHKSGIPVSGNDETHHFYYPPADDNSDSPPPLPNSPPPLPSVPPPDLGDASMLVNTSMDPLSSLPPLSPSTPVTDSFPKVPPRRDLITPNAANPAASVPDITGSGSVNLPSIPFNANLTGLVEMRTNTGSSERVGSGRRVAPSLRNSYYVYKDDQTHTMREDSSGFMEGRTITGGNDLEVIGNGSPGLVHGTQAYGQADDDNLYDSPPSTMYNY